MKRMINGDELKQVELDILSGVHEFCQKHDIKYFLAFGTLIGAVRHGGFIPWDDDIDIVMLRDDYERFCREFVENPPENLKLCSIDTLDSYYLPIAKIIDDRTVLKETQLDGCEIGVYIDIFPLDSIPDDPKDKAKYFKTLSKYHTLNNLKKAKQIEAWPKYKQMMLPLIKLLLLPISKRALIKRLLKAKQSYSHTNDTEGVGTFIFGVVGKIPKRRYFDETVELEFEGRRFCAPAEYHELLTDWFGDYMQLPPEDQRVTHHCFEAWWKE